MSSFPNALALLDRTPVGALARCPVLVGLDGFVDTILHVVAQRQTADQYTRMTETREFAGRINEAAGRSANFEFVTRMVKLGGNGPIMANALSGFGAPVTYLGNLGAPVVDPIFNDFARRCERVISVAEPARTDAIEFEDGKLMCGQERDAQGRELGQHPAARLAGGSKGNLRPLSADCARELDDGPPHDRHPAGRSCARSSRRCPPRKTGPNVGCSSTWRTRPSAPVMTLPRFWKSPWNTRNISGWCWD